MRGPTHERPVEIAQELQGRHEERSARRGGNRGCVAGHRLPPPPGGRRPGGCRAERGGGRRGAAVLPGPGGIGSGRPRAAGRPDRAPPLPYGPAAGRTGGKAAAQGTHPLRHAHSRQLPGIAGHGAGRRAAEGSPQRGRLSPPGVRGRPRRRPARGDAAGRSGRRPGPQAGCALPGRPGEDARGGRAHFGTADGGGAHPGGREHACGRVAALGSGH